ncbi:MAG TPA: bifunctional [glutamine synthetase] adenylyltransferase/[glutamine synthetase]-adenylyl-L-tyrosine phosphorylase, partial [Beijerinckiaceae bacterium]|nr:bifunctional [glutamine synthetase] adenylyltransferase/[glutamine synthetase]-adenylyl-L-tyrosine phosphorylase [Beijerinckiaceae bacterium]
ELTADSDLDLVVVYDFDEERRESAGPRPLDAVIDPAFTEPVFDEARIDEQVRGLIGRPGDFEDFLDRTRDAARQMRFITGARMLSGILAPAQAGEAFSAVAAAVVRASLASVQEAFAHEHGSVPGGRIAVLGLGRLGSRELTADSDLDLVVVYDFDEERRESTGPRPLDAVVYYTRLTQRLVSALTAPTRRGRLYEVDLRLRPQGGKGPLASQFRGFVAYQAGEAELWEHMALTRARVLAADASFGDEVAAAVAGIVAQPRSPAEVAKQVRAMRALIAQEKGDRDPWDIKLAAGGLTDVDFLAQAILLAHGRDRPDLVGRPTDEVLLAAAALGLTGAEEARELVEAHRLFGAVLHWQRLMIAGPFDPAAVSPAILKRLAAAVGLPDAGVLLRQLDDARARVRAIAAEAYDRMGATPAAGGTASKRRKAPTG